MTNVQFTQYGNPYQSTSTGKKVGFAAGALTGGFAGYKIMESVLSDNVCLNKLAEKYVNKQGPNINPEYAKNNFYKLVKKLPKCSLFAGAAIIGGVGLAIGAIVDKIKNHNRQVVADLTKNYNDNKS